MSLESLYQEIILDHYRTPRNFRPLDADARARLHENPTCGDSLRLSVEIDAAGQLCDIAFDGKGCAISMASSSMMTELVKGRAVREARARIECFVSAMRGERDPSALDELGDLASLKGVIHYPVRVKCATLAWHALEEALATAEAGAG